jgi:hypothetical protein
MLKNTKTLPKPIRRKVHIKEIEVDEDTFQPRSGKTDPRHVAALKDVLVRGVELDPLLVWQEPDTGNLIVGDGHHRLEAYTQARWQKQISVDVYLCDRDTALQLSMVENSKQRKNLYDRECRNYAWKRVVDGAWSIPMIVDRCRVSRGTVKNMRRTLRKLREALDSYDEDDILALTWNAARLKASGIDLDPYDDEESMRVAIARANETFGSELTNLSQRWPEATGELFSKCAGDNLPRALSPLGYQKTDPYGIPEDEDGTAQF